MGIRWNKMMSFYDKDMLCIKGNTKRKMSITLCVFPSPVCLVDYSYPKFTIQFKTVIYFRKEDLRGVCVRISKPWLQARTLDLHGFTETQSREQKF